MVQSFEGMKFSLGGLGDCFAVDLRCLRRGQINSHESAGRFGGRVVSLPILEHAGWALISQPIEDKIRDLALLLP